MLKRVLNVHKFYDECYRWIGELADKNLKLLVEVERLKNTSNNRLCGINSNDTDSVDSERDDDNSNTLNSNTESDMWEDLNNIELFGLKKGFLVDSTSDNGRKKRHK